MYCGPILLLFTVCTCTTSLVALHLHHRDSLSPAWTQEVGEGVLPVAVPSSMLSTPLFLFSQDWIVSVCVSVGSRCPVEEVVRVVVAQASMLQLPVVAVRVAVAEQTPCPNRRGHVEREVAPLVPLAVVVEKLEVVEAYLFLARNNSVSYQSFSFAAFPLRVLLLL